MSTVITSGTISPGTSGELVPHIPPYSGSLSFTPSPPSGTQSGDDTPQNTGSSPPVFPLTSTPISDPRSPTTTQSRVTSSLIHVPQDHERNVDEIAAFLGSCAPSMGFLLESFISFGCCNRHFLASIAGWGDDEIGELLRKIVCAPQAQAMGSEMVIWILRRHLKSIFGKQTLGNKVLS